MGRPRFGQGRSLRGRVPPLTNSVPRADLSSVRPSPPSPIAGPLPARETVGGGPLCAYRSALSELDSHSLRSPAQPRPPRLTRLRLRRSGDGIQSNSGAPLARCPSRPGARRRHSPAASEKARHMVTLQPTGSLWYPTMPLQGSAAALAVREIGSSRCAETSASRRRARGHSRPTLQPPNREDVRRLDPALHPLPRQAPSRRDGGAGDHALPDLAGRRCEGGGLDPDSSPERVAVPVPRDPPAAGPRLDDLVYAKAPAPSARRADPRRGPGRPRRDARRAAAHDVPALRRWPSPARVLSAPSRERRRLRSQPDRGALRQGRQGPAHDAAGRHQAGSPEGI